MKSKFRPLIEWGDYNFSLYELDKNFFQKIIIDGKEFKGNYIFARKIGNFYYAIYIGKSTTVADRILDRIDDPVNYIDKEIFNFSTTVHIRKEKLGVTRKKIEKELIGICNPPLNYDYRSDLAPEQISRIVQDRRMNKYGKFE